MLRVSGQRKPGAVRGLKAELVECQESLIRHHPAANQLVEEPAWPPPVAARG